MTRYPDRVQVVPTTLNQFQSPRHMRTYLRPLPGTSAVRSSCEDSMIDAISAHFSTLDARQAILRRTAAISGHFADVSKRASLDSRIQFRRKEYVLGSGPRVSTRANFYCDMTAVCGCVGAKQSKTFFELCFNNREAIGTNFLKLDAARRNCELPDKQAQCVLICPSESLLRAGNWDPAYADADEYFEFYNRVIDSQLTSRFSILEILY